MLVILIFLPGVVQTEGGGVSWIVGSGVGLLDGSFVDVHERLRLSTVFPHVPPRDAVQATLPNSS